MADGARFSCRRFAQVTLPFAQDAGRAQLACSRGCWRSARASDRERTFVIFMCLRRRHPLGRAAWPLQRRGRRPLRARLPGRRSCSNAPIAMSSAPLRVLRLPADELRARRARTRAVRDPRVMEPDRALGRTSRQSDRPARARLAGHRRVRQWSSGSMPSRGCSTFTRRPHGLRLLTALFRRQAARVRHWRPGAGALKRQGDLRRLASARAHAGLVDIDLGLQLA